jgi:protein SCO1/2
MKKLLPFFLGAVAVLAADKLPAPSTPAIKPPCCRNELAPGKYTDRSIYQLESVWTSDVGREIKLGVLQGQPQVLAMFFSHCEYACPITVNNMLTIERDLPETLRERVDFLLVSFDTERDTLEALRAYRERMKLSPAHWTLLRGREDDVRELAALLGINYQKDARGQFAHSNVITVLNAAGEIAHQEIGLHPQTAEIVKAVEKMVAPAR